MLPLESVPNFSEGRDQATIDAIGDALAAHARLLDVHSDADHNRSVFTLVGSEDELGDALVAGIGVAVERIDLRRHDGAHPCIGAADVVPIVPLRPEDMERARARSRDDRCPDRSARAPGVPLRAARARAGVLPARRSRRARAAARGRRARARLRAGRAARDRGRRDPRRPRAADRVQRQPPRSARRSRARSRRSCASGAAASPASARSGSTCRARVSCRCR